ncbi:SDR family NAD(P)-dependent oxidoreductase [Pseudomonas helleri]|uniref:SDR family NAD(P)-dependent oxidoreductase n=1 Tax=Pseudomonas helleri TaxID=1608996 RepID=UPI003340CB10
MATILISGASAGFGEHTARRLVELGHKVIAVARRADRLEELRGELGGNLYALPVDLADKSAISSSLAALPAEFSEVDILINNAGLALGVAKAQEAKLADWDAMIDVNIRGLVYLTHAVLPGMVARDRGHVINLGSVAADNPYPGGNVYGSTKAFVRQFSRNLRADLHGSQVRVTTIQPGLSAGTEFTTVRLYGDADKAAERYQGVAALQPSDIAESIVWAISRPPHVNINEIEIMPVSQSWAALPIHRTAL